jgi:hypothetical protein
MTHFYKWYDDIGYLMNVLKRKSKITQSCAVCHRKAWKDRSNYYAASKIAFPHSSKTLCESSIVNPLGVQRLFDANQEAFFVCRVLVMKMLQ